MMINQYKIKNQNNLNHSHKKIQLKQLQLQLQLQLQVKKRKEKAKKTKQALDTLENIEIGALKKYNAKELKAFLKSKKLLTQGNKGDLVNRALKQL